jgi:isopentenyl-diphosphate Delta-isomerase
VLVAQTVKNLHGTHRLLTNRKNEHLDIVLAHRGNGGKLNTGFDDIIFEHTALPEIDMEDICVDTVFLHKRISAPLLVSSMTGGPIRAAQINHNLALASQELNLALAVGSQRIALESDGVAGLDAELRRLAPDIPLLANFGAAQLNLGFGVEHARRAIDMIGADALIIHLNPLQEALQTEGNRNWKGLLNRIEILARELNAPIVVKEVGCGISGRLARRLIDVGVSVIDVAGAGGTSWAAVEAERAITPQQVATARAFVDWGQHMGKCFAEVRASCPNAVIIGSGGIKDGLHVAKAIRLGADMAGQAAGVLHAATQSPEAVVEHFSVVIAQLRVACFCTGSSTLDDLRHARLQRGYDH